MQIGLPHVVAAAVKTRPVPCIGVLAVVVSGMLLFAATGQAQNRLSTAGSSFELSETVQVERADGAVLTHMERVKACLEDRQWDEAVETLRKVMESGEGRLLAATPWRYVNLSDACQMQLAALPAEALKLYRRRVDPIARAWCEKGIAGRDAGLLTQVVQQAFASSWGDKALMALGEIRLEEGDFSAARWCWERILPVRPPPGEASAWPGYPDSTLDPAAVRARIVLASILEGSTERAREELAEFARLHGEARGRLGGSEVVYSAALSKLLNQSSAWPKPPQDADWPTFAGSPGRNARAHDLVDVAGIEWRVKFRSPVPAPAAGPELRALGVADDPAAPLSFHPVVSQRRIFVVDNDEIFGVRADDGRPVWGDEVSFFHETGDAPVSEPSAADSFGTPRYTLTVADGRLYARLGPAFTVPSPQPGVSPPGAALVCLDLRAGGKYVWKIDAEAGWSFDGAPVVEGGRLFIAMRRSDIRPQMHVACFDATTARLRWRRFICSAETPGRGNLADCPHDLLTLAGGTLYVNTNLGAVAALAADNGRIHWLSLYPRARTGNLARPDSHWRRDLNPCLFDRGRLYVAPADSRRVYAFDAATGQVLWPGRSSDRPADTPVQDPLDDVVHLLGVSGNRLIAGGHRLYWIETDGPRAGNIARVWPENGEKLGYGRGLLTETQVLWPTREKIYVFDAQTARRQKEIDLTPLGIRGGNLLVLDGRLLIATAHELIALGIHPKKADPPTEIVGTTREPVRYP